MVAGVGAAGGVISTQVERIQNDRVVEAPRPAPAPRDEAPAPRVAPAPREEAPPPEPRPAPDRGRVVDRTA